MSLGQRATARDMRYLFAMAACMVGSVLVAAGILIAARRGGLDGRILSVGGIALLLLPLSYGLWPPPRPRPTTFALYPFPFGALVTLSAVLNPLLRGNLPSASVSAVAVAYAAVGVPAFVRITRRTSRSKSKDSPSR